jgi:DNA primase
MAFDDDVAGREATEKIGKLLRSPLHKEQIMLALVKLELPAGRDPGDLSPDEYQRIFQRAFTRVKRSI